MKNITKIFLDTAPVETRLSFGVNDNVVLKSISNKERRNKDGIVINSLFNMTFVKYNEEDRVIAESLFNYFVADNADYAASNLIHQIMQIFSIARAVVPANDVNNILSDMNKFLGSEDILPTIKLAGALNKKGKIATKKEVAAIVTTQRAVLEEFTTILTPFLGDNSDRVSLLVVTGSNGKFLGLPREDTGFIKKSGKKIAIDKKYHTWYAKRNVKEKANADNIGGDEVIDVASVQFDASGDLGDI